MPAVSERQVLSRECWHRPDRVKRCTRCGEEKVLREFYSYGYVTGDGKPSTRYESRCRPCARERRREAVARNPEQSRRQCQAWRARNLEHAREKARQYQQTDHGRRMKAKSQRLRKARMRSGQPDDPAIRAIYAEAMRIEQAIQCCPVFDIPELGKKMHVDHIMPLSRGGLHIASNLQILPIGINMRKGTKCPR